MSKTRDPRNAIPRRRRPRATPTTVEQLVRQQGVKHVYDLDELGSLLPPEADPDDFLDFLNAERGARRASARNGKR